jgi:hypothetical protein
MYDSKRNLPNQVPNIYFRKEIPEIVGVVLIRKYEFPPKDYYCNFIIPSGSIFFPIMSEAIG